MNEPPHDTQECSAAFERVPAAARTTRAALVSSALAQVVRDAALRLPSGIVDDAQQEAWVRWFAAVHGSGVARPLADPTAYLVGIFRHVCADAMRAHRRRQHRCGLASDLGIEPQDVVDERPARGFGGGALIDSSRRSCDQRSSVSRRPTSNSGSLPRSSASVGTRLELRRG